jgi:hypothetical protein
VSACEKVGYATKHEAKAAKRDCQRTAAQGVTWRNESRIYRCPACASWHLTSTPHYAFDLEE